MALVWLVIKANASGVEIGPEDKRDPVSTLFVNDEVRHGPELRI